MKAIDIQINQAKITSYAVSLKDTGVPDVSASIELMAGEKEIASFSLHTHNWQNSGVKFELPVNMIEPIVEISKQLEVILVRECNKQLKRLPVNDTVDAEKVKVKDE